MKRKKKNASTNRTTIASLAALAASSALLFFAGLASAQPTSIAGLVQSLPGGTTIKPCPPPGFDSLPNLNVTSYISAPWYIQQQVGLVFYLETGRKRQ